MPNQSWYAGRQCSCPLERDHAERLRPNIRRAMPLNILPATLQPRLLEHLDCLVDYGQVREKVVSLVQMQRSPDAMACSQVYSEEDEWTEQEAEGYTAEEEAVGLAALADVVCRRCNKKGHSARSCKLPPRAWKGGKSTGKGTRFMGSYGGKGGASPPGPPCPGCGKPGHAKEKC